MTFGSSLLAAIPGLRHAFFTREGGISSGIYEGLNGGLGSNDDPASVAENRRRMAEQMGGLSQNEKARALVRQVGEKLVAESFDLFDAPPVEPVLSEAERAYRGLRAAKTTEAAA